MTKDEFKQLRDVRAAQISGTDLIDQTDRTLIRGYTCDRLDYEIWLSNGVIYKQIGAGSVLVGDFYPEELAPDKRAYPADCDFEFCSLLASRGVWLCFAPWPLEVE